MSTPFVSSHLRLCPYEDTHTADVDGCDDKAKGKLSSHLYFTRYDKNMKPPHNAKEEWMTRAHATT